MVSRQHPSNIRRNKLFRTRRIGIVKPLPDLVQAAKCIATPVGTRRSIGSGKTHVPVVSYAMAFIRSTFSRWVSGCRPTTSRNISKLNGRKFRSNAWLTHINLTRQTLPLYVRFIRSDDTDINDRAGSWRWWRDDCGDGGDSVGTEAEHATQKPRKVGTLACHRIDRRPNATALVTRRRTAPTSKRRRRRHRHRRQGDGARRSFLSCARTCRIDLSNRTDMTRYRDVDYIRYVKWMTRSAAREFRASL